MRSSAREWPYAVAAAALAAVVFAVPQLLRARTGMPMAFGTESYALISPQFTDAAPITQMLAQFPFVFPLIGGVAIGILWMVLSGTVQERIATVTIAALSPALLNAYGTPSTATIPTLLALVAMLFRNNLPVCAAVGVLLGTESIAMATVTALILLGYTQLRNGLALAGGAIIGFLIHPQLMSIIVPAIPITQSIAEFGGTYGIPAMAILLAFFGFRFWRMPAPLVGAVLLVPWYGALVLPLVTIGVAAAGGPAFAAFATARWRHPGFRFTTLALIVCGVLFSTAVSMQHAMHADPTPSYWALREFSGIAIADQPTIVEGVSRMRVVNIAHTQEERNVVELLNDELQTDNWFLVDATFRKHEVTTVVLSSANTYPWAAEIAEHGTVLMETPTLTVWDVRNI